MMDTFLQRRRTAVLVLAGAAVAEIALWSRRQEACRFVDGDLPSRNRPTCLPDGGVAVNGAPVDVDRDGLPTMDEILLPARHHGVALGTFLVTAATRIARPTLEQREVAVLLADQVGAELASRPSRRT